MLAEPFSFSFIGKEIVYFFGMQNENDRYQPHVFFDIDFIFSFMHYNSTYSHILSHVQYADHSTIIYIYYLGGILDGMRDIVC